MRNHFATRTGALLLAATALSTAAPAFAQAQPDAAAAGQTQTPAAGTATPAPTDAAQDNAGIKDVVVTAERSTSTVQRTPAAITAIGGEALATRGVTDLVSAAATAPAVHINNFTAGLQVVIRGVYTQSPSPSADPAVSFNLDGVYQARPASTAGTFYDVDRVEILRGPQGTLYGRNTTGGAINLITNKPVDATEGSIEAGVGNYGLFQTTAVFNTPITDTLYLRVAGNIYKHSGYIDNYPAKDGDDADTQAGRVQLLWKPDNKFSFRLIGDYSHDGGVGGVERPLTDRDNDFAFPLNTTGSLDTRTYGVSGEANYDLGAATLTYIGAYRHLNYNYFADFDFTATKNATTDIDQHEWQVTNELRVSSNPGHGPLQYVVGLYQFHEETPYTQTQENSPAPGITTISSAPVINATAYAAYGQATYSLTSALRLTGGLRFTYDKKDQDAVYTSGGVELANNSGGKSWTALNYKVGAEYDLTSSNMLYANVSTAYKAGGVNLSIPASTYDPEHLTAFVAGIKNRFFNNHLQFNVEAFYYDYKDYQGALLLSTPTAHGNVMFNAVINAGKARLYGIEAESTLKLTQNDQFDGYISYLNTKFVNYLAGTTNYTGNELAKAPPVEFTIGYQHVLRLHDLGHFTLRGEFHYEGDQYMSPSNAATAFQKHFHESNAFLRYDSENGKWYINAFVRNIENGVHLTHVATGAYINDPRTVGFLAGIRF
jgi:iron complex outermembrane receptor protein